MHFYISCPELGQSTVKLRRVWKVLVSPSEKKKPARPSRNIKDDSLKGTYTAWAPDSPERERESERERGRNPPSLEPQTEPKV